MAGICSSLFISIREATSPFSFYGEALFLWKEKGLIEPGSEDWQPPILDSLDNHRIYVRWLGFVRPIFLF